MQYLASHAVDVMLLDIIMPEMDGFETILTILGTKERPAIIAITGGSQKLDLDFILSVARKLQVDGILLKPVSYEAFCNAVKSTGSTNCYAMYWFRFDIALTMHVPVVFREIHS